MIRKTLRFCGLFCLICIILPIAVGAWTGYAKGWPRNWSAADWSSSNTIPAATPGSPAMIRIYAARSGRWKGIFAVHHWIVFKPAGAASYTRFDVVGWGRPLRRDNYPPDGYWYSNTPNVVHEITGPQAAALIPKIEKTIENYPWRNRGDYTIFPGPNSNTFVAHVLRQVPELRAEMDATGVGKDYLGPGLRIAPTISGTGWQISLNGIVGLAVGWEEGIELHLMGGTIGVDLDDFALKLPALGKISPLDLWPQINR